MRDPHGFQIQLDNQARSFFPGETISGRVVASFTTPREHTGISVTFDGRAKVRWMEKKKGDKFSSTITQRGGQVDSVPNSLAISAGYKTAEEIYFRHELSLVQTEEGTTKVILPTGPSFFPFQYTLPLNLPSSFVSDSSNILYFITAEMSHPRKSKSSRAVLTFTVNGILDLNEETGVGDSVELSKRKRINFMCCTWGHVEFKLSLLRKGFVPGENIEFSAEMKNYSRENVEQSSLSLIQITILNVGDTSKTQEKELRKIIGPGVLWGDSETWSDECGGELIIPPLPPTRLAGCSIIDVQYKLKLEMEFRSSLTANLSAELPIVIGTIPLRSYFAEYIPGPTPRPSTAEVDNIEETLSSRDSVSSDSRSPRNSCASIYPSVPIFLAYPDLPPPSYAEAMVRLEQNIIFGTMERRAAANRTSSPKDETTTRMKGVDEPSASEVSEAEPEETQPPTPQSPDPEFIYNSNLFAPNYVRYLRRTASCLV